MNENDIKKEEAARKEGGEEAKAGKNQPAEAKNEGKHESKKEMKALREKAESLEKKVSELEKENADLKDKAAAEKDDYIRLLAEFQTFRRRTEDERKDIISNAAGDTIKGLLPVLDDCERAMQLLEKSSDEAAKQGTSLIYDKLLGYLKTKGLEKMDAKGKKFDTDLHEAVAKVPAQDESQKGLVYDVIQTGYTLNGKVLRFAKVVVGI